MKPHILGKYISILHRHKQRYVNQRMRDDGLGYAGYNFLIYVLKHEGCSQKDMCRDLAIDEAQATRKINRMVQEGYLSRVKEGRGYSLRVDRRGREVLPRLYQTLDEWWNAVLEGMPERDVEELAACLARMAERARRQSEGEEDNGHGEQ